MLQLRMAVTEQSEVGQARRDALRLAQNSDFKEPHLGRIALLAAELATNLAKHAKFGELLMQVYQDGGKNTFEFLSLDRGPGIEDVARCMEDGYSTAGSPGTGLGAIARAADEFDIYSDLKTGTAAVARIAPGKHAHSAAVIHQAKSGESICGDAWLVKECDGRSLCAVADGLGHGPLAASAAMAIVGAINAMRSFPTPLEIIEVAHQAAKSTCEASVGVAILNPDAHEVRFAGIGTVSAMVINGNVRNHLVSGAGVVGDVYRKIKEFSLPWSKESILVMHSDGVSERWDLNCYPGLSNKHPSLLAGIIYRDFSRPADDKTVIIKK
jgi:anti-sigma regulatory factor (Ser/Thr protein kinase)